MNLRILSITVGLLVALSAIVWVVRRPAPPTSTDARIGQPILAPDVAAQVVRFKLTDQGKTVELARAADGTWSVPSYHDFPADVSKLSQLLTNLTEAKIRRLVTARSERLARLEFKDTTVTLSDSSGNTLWNVTLGKTADGGGRYLRFGTEEKGYLANLSAWLDADSKNWADSTLLDLKADEIARVDLSFNDGATLSVSRAKKEDPWAPAAPTVEPAGRKLNSDRINALLPSFVALRFTDTTALDDPKATAARAHARTIKLTTFSQKTYTVTLARTPEETRPKAPPPAGAVSPSPESGTPTSGPPEGDKPKEPEVETIPAGPVFVTITAPDSDERLNALMQKRAFQITEWAYTSLPTNIAEFWNELPTNQPPASTAEPSEPSPDPKP